MLVEARTAPAPARRGRALPRRRSRSAMREPVGTSTWVGASASRRRAGPRAGARRSASARSSGPMSASPALPTRCGASQSSIVAASAVIREVGPFLALGAAQEHHPLAPLRQRLRPRQRVEPERGDAARERPRGLLGRRRRQRALGERERPEPPHGPGSQGPGGAVEARPPRPRRSAAPTTSSTSAARQRRGRQDTGRGGARRRSRRWRGNGSRASRSCASSTAPRPFAMRYSPGLPRALAMRSG